MEQPIRPWGSVLLAMKARKDTLNDILDQKTQAVRIERAAVRELEMELLNTLSRHKMLSVELNSAMNRSERIQSEVDKMEAHVIKIGRELNEGQRKKEKTEVQLENVEHQFQVSRNERHTNEQQLEEITKKLTAFECELAKLEQRDKNATIRLGKLEEALAVSQKALLESENKDNLACLKVEKMDQEIHSLTMRVQETILTAEMNEQDIEHYQSIIQEMSEEIANLKTSNANA